MGEDVKRRRLKEIAEILDGNEMYSELAGVDMEELKNQGIVVVYGYSDDNVELRGAIDREIGALNGTSIPLSKDGLVENQCDNEDCPYYQEKLEEAVVIDALWGEEPPYSWTFDIEILYQSFDILEDGEKFCRGIVFFLEDVEKTKWYYG